MRVRIRVRVGVRERGGAFESVKESERVCVEESKRVREQDGRRVGGYCARQKVTGQGLEEFKMSALKKPTNTAMGTP